VPVEVEQFAGAWYRIPETLQYRVDDEPPGGTIGLGEGAILGDEVWDAQIRVRLRVGPMSRARYADFLPGGAAYESLRALTRFYTDGEMEFEVRLVLDRNDVQGITLGGDSPDELDPLGWSTWIRTRAFTRDPDDTTLTL
jgi:type VI secretion system protein ImpH